MKDGILPSGSAATTPPFFSKLNVCPPAAAYAFHPADNRKKTNKSNEQRGVKPTVNEWMEPKEIEIT